MGQAVNNQPLTTLWKNELLDSLKKHHEDGLSATLIASRINEQYGTAFTRNAIIGAAHRAGLPKRQSKQFAGTHAIERRIKPRRDNGGGSVYSIARRQITGFKPLEKQRVSIAPFLAIPLLDLESGQCRFPRGESPILFCGQPQKEGSSYCPHCHSIATRIANVC